MFTIRRNWEFDLIRSFGFYFSKAESNLFDIQIEIRILLKISIRCKWNSGEKRIIHSKIGWIPVLSGTNEFRVKMSTPEMLPDLPYHFFFHSRISLNVN